MYFFSFLFFLLASLSVSSTAKTIKGPNYGICIRTIWEQSETGSNVQTKINGKASYRTDEAWANLKISITKFSKDAVLQIDKVLVGYCPIWDEESNLFIEIGRAPLNSIFCSGLQFNAPFNGLHIGYKNKNITIHGGMTVFGEQGEMWGAVAELIYEFEKIPLILVHSYSNWDRYNISQTTVNYELGVIKDHPVIIYGSFLRNLSSMGHAHGWELGTTVGKVLKNKDVKMNVVFKKISKKSIPEYDFPKMQGLQIKGTYTLSEKLALSASLWFNKLGNVELGTHYIF